MRWGEVATGAANLEGIARPDGDAVGKDDKAQSAGGLRVKSKV
jgi:hypothetical protein